MTENESYTKKYNKYIIDETVQFTAYRIIKAFREVTEDDSLCLIKSYGKPQTTGQYFGINTLVEPMASKVFIEIEFGPDVNIMKNCNMEKIWNHIQYEYNKDYRKEIIANLDIGSIVWDYGNDANRTEATEVDFDGGEGPDRTGQTGTAPDFMLEYYFWRKDTAPESIDELIKNREDYLRYNETHMWPELTMKNINISKNQDSRPHISLWAIGYWMSMSGEYEILEDSTYLEGLIMKEYSNSNEATARQKYNTIRFGLEDIIDHYDMRSDDFDKNNIPLAYADFEDLVNETFGKNYKFIDGSEKVYYVIGNKTEVS